MVAALRAQKRQALSVEHVEPETFFGRLDPGEACKDVLREILGRIKEQPNKTGFRHCLSTAYAVVIALDYVNPLSVIVLSTPGWNFDRVAAKPVGNRGNQLALISPYCRARSEGARRKR